MSQQAKDIYSGIKKIFPGSHRSGSFSLSGRTSAVSLGAELSVEAQAVACERPRKKERPSSFSFSSWKDKHRASSEPAPPVVMSLPYGATAATPEAKKSGKLSENGTRPSLTQAFSNAFQTTSGRGSLFGKSSTKATSKGSTSSHSSFSTTSFELAEPPNLGNRSVSVGGSRSCMNNRTLRNSGVHGNMALQLQLNATLSALPSSSHSTSHRHHGLTSYSSVKTASNSYHSNSSSLSSHTARGNSQASSTDTVVYSPKKKTKKERRLSLSFSSSARSRKKREKEEAEREEQESAKRTSATIDEQATMRPHSSTWDSDSDDDYEDTKRPTRGLDRRSQSMDFMEQAPTHLISKIWRKLPIQARLIGGRGNIDLDLQKDRTSFTRSSEARKFALAAEKAKQAELQRRSLSGAHETSPVSAKEVLSPGVAKRTRFSSKLIIVASDANDGTAGAYTALENYDDVLVRVCKFASHDQRPTTTKVQEFLERSMAFLHGTRTKHGNVVNISNGEIRMWRRLALHDWTLEEVTTAQAAAALGVKGKDVQAPSSRKSSAATEGTDSDSDGQGQSKGRRRLHSAALDRTLSASIVEEEPEMEEDEDEELEVPSKMKFAKLCDVINCCVSSGEVLFTPDEIKDLVRLEFIVEEDGWI